MNLETYKGRRIIYRPKGSAKRISYNRLKKGLVKTNKVIEVDVLHLLFDDTLRHSRKVNGPEIFSILPEPLKALNNGDDVYNETLYKCRGVTFVFRVLVV